VNKFREHIGQGVAEKNTRRAEASNHWDSVIGGAPKKAQTSRAPKNRLTIMRGGYYPEISMQVRVLPPCQNNGRDGGVIGRLTGGHRGNRFKTCPSRLFNTPAYAGSSLFSKAGAVAPVPVYLNGVSYASL